MVEKIFPKPWWQNPQKSPSKQIQIILATQAMHRKQGKPLNFSIDVLRNWPLSLKPDRIIWGSSLHLPLGAPVQGKSPSGKHVSITLTGMFQWKLVTIASKLVHEPTRNHYLDSLPMIVNNYYVGLSPIYGTYNLFITMRKSIY